jgi:hypothetical protein
MKKFLFRGFLVLLLLIAVAAVGLYFSLNSIIKDQVETQGTAATGVQTTLQSVNLSPFSGAVSLNDFLLNNPEGFSDSHIFSLGEADVQVEIASLLSDEVVLPTVSIDGATVLLELDGLDLNAVKLLEQIKANAPAEPTADEPAAEREGKAFLIKQLDITNTKVVGRLRLPGGLEQDVDLTLAPINQTDVRGVELGDVIAFAVQTVLLNASRQVAEVVPNLDQLQGQLGNLSDEVLGGVGTEIDKVVPGAGDAVKEAAGREVGRALDDLFGNRDDEAETTEETTEEE